MISSPHGDIGLLLMFIGEGNGNPLQYSCLENPVDGGAWWAADHGVAQSQTSQKRLSMRACIMFIIGKIYRHTRAGTFGNLCHISQINL